MANIKSAKKRAHQALKRRAINLARRTALKTAIKKVILAVEKGDVQGSVELLRQAESQLAQAKSKGLVHAGNASRRVSRLAKRVAKGSQPSA